MVDENEARQYSATVLVVWYVVFSIFCMGVAYGFAPPEWGVLKMVAAGGLGGAISFFCVFANHVLLL